MNYPTGISTILLRRSRSILSTGAIILGIIVVVQINGLAQNPPCSDKAVDLEKQLIRYSNEIKAEPKRADLYVARAEVLRGLRRNAEAMKDADRAIELDPKSDGAYEMSGYLYDDRASFGWAILQYNKAINLNPKNANLFYARGRARGLRGESAAAIKDFGEALALLPDEPHSLLGRGLEYQKRGDRANAEKDFNSGVEIFSRIIGAAGTQDCLSGVLESRSTIYFALGKLEEGFADLSTAIQLRPNSSWLLFQRGRRRALNGQYSDALADLTRAAEIYPEFGLIYKKRAQVYDALKQKERADADRALFEKLSNSSPSSGSKPK